MPPVAARSPGYRLAAAGLAPPAPPSSSTSTSTTTTTTATDRHRSHVSALGISSPSSADASPPPHDSREKDPFLPKRHNGGDGDEDEDKGEALRRRVKGRRSLFSSASSSPGLPHSSKKQFQQQERRQGPPPTPPTLLARSCKCSPISRLCAVALLALAATLSLCVAADVAGAALYARAGAAGALSPDARFWDRWEAALLRKAAGGPMTVALERHWLGAKRELVARRWRTVVAAAAGSLRHGMGGGGNESGVAENNASHPSSLLAFPPTLPSFLSSSCSDLLADYAPLVARDLRPWPRVTRAMVESDPDRLYFVGGRAYLPRGASRGRLMPTFHAFLQRLALRAALPDLVVPLNVADEPRVPWEAGREWGREGGREGGLDDEAALLRGEGGGNAAATTDNSRHHHHRSSSNSSSSSPRPNPPDPLFSFCKTRDYADILIPNTIEGDVFVRPRDGKKRKRKMHFPPLDVADATPEEEARRLLLPRVTAATSVTTHRKVRAGASDPRPATAVWRGSTGGFGGLRKGRAALLELGRRRPDLLDSGVYDWDEGRWGPPEGRVKPRMGLADQVDGHKCVLFC